MKVFAAVLVALGLSISTAWAGPTPVNRTVSWDHDGAGIAGFYVYYARQATPGYSDVNRVQVPDPALRTLAVPDITTAKGALCFVVTAYDAQGAESAYSNEACGFFGVTAPGNVRVQ